jgi:hypothetical protein
MTPISSQVAQALEDSLQVIAKDNGYFTNLGNAVFRGFYAHAISGRSAVYPLIAVQPENETVTGSTDSRSKIESVVRLICVTDDQVVPADILRACAADVRKALATNLAEKLGAIKVNTPGTLGTVEFATASDSHLSMAAISVAFTFIEQYEA